MISQPMKLVIIVFQGDPVHRWSGRYYVAEEHRAATLSPVD